MKAVCIKVTYPVFELKLPEFNSPVLFEVFPLNPGDNEILLKPTRKNPEEKAVFNSFADIKTGKVKYQINYKAKRLQLSETDCYYLKKIAEEFYDKIINQL